MMSHIHLPNPAKHSPIRLSVCLAVMLLSALSFVVQAQYAFRNIGMETGLQSSHVKALTRDRLGFVWIGTANGLSRYDGTSVKNYRCYDSRLKKGNNNINSLYCAADDTLWIGTDRGVYTYNPHTDDINYFTGWDHLNDGFLNWVESIHGDKSGNIWVLIPDMGIFRHSKAGNSQYRMPEEGKKYKEDYFTDITVTADGVLWACSSNGKIFRFDKGYDEMVEVNFNFPTDSPKQKFAQIIPFEKDIIVASETGKIWRLSPARNFSVSQIPFHCKEDTYVRRLQAIDNELWIGTQNGLYRYDLTAGTQASYPHTDMPTSIADDAIYTLYADNRGNLWAGTMFGGAAYTVRDSFHFVCLPPVRKNNRRIRGMVLADHGNKMVLGSQSNGVMIYDMKSDTYSSAPSPLSSEHGVSCLGSVKDATVAALDRMGIWLLEWGKAPVNYCPQLRDKTVYSYLLDSGGNEWIGTGNGLYRKKNGEAQYKWLDETYYHWIFALKEATNGEIWIGTMGNGLYRYNPKTDRFDSYIYNEDKPDSTSLRSNSINSITEDRKGRIWISTDRGGLSLYDRDSNGFTSYGSDTGLPDDVVYKVLEDNAGNLWFGTNRGLVRFNPDNKVVKTFTTQDGLPSNEFMYNSAVNDGDSLFFFGTSDGVFRFNPTVDDSPNKNIPILFTSFIPGHTDSRPENTEERLYENIVFSQELKIPYNQNTFTLTVGVPAALELTGDKKYFYRLLPAHDSWVTMEDNKISFSNLSHGKYTLEVKMVCGDLESVGSIKIRVLPPWWLSLPANIIYVLLLILCVFLFFCAYRKREHKRLKEKQAAFTANKEKELYEQKLNFFTEIAHEIRTPLSLIDLPLEAMEEKGLDHPDSTHYLKVTRQNTSRLLELTSQLLDFQKIEAGKLRLKYEAVDVAELIQKTADRFEPAIRLKDKVLRCEMPKSGIVTTTDREALTKIISNLLNNALKYSTSIIDVKMTADSNNLTIMIASDGEKISDANREHIFETFYQTDKSQEQKNGVGIGLPLSRSLARLLGGDLYLEKESDRYRNVFVVSLPRQGAENVVRTAVADEQHLSFVYEDDSNQTPLQADGYRILLVEDNDGIRDMLKDRLSGSFLMILASNGKEALEILRRQQVDAIVTDIMMPEMDGMELCRRVKEDPQLSHVPVVFITAKNDLDSKIKGLQYGAEAYIEKPFSIKYLREMVTTLLENRRRARESFAKTPFFQAENIPVNKSDEEFMNKVLVAIKENMADENFNVEGLCDVLCMSRSNLLRHIKGVFNLSPGELIRVVRLKSAAELLKAGGRTIGEISQMVGISSQSYFTKMFFKQFNITPNEFARQFISDSGNTQN